MLKTIKRSFLGVPSILPRYKGGILHISDTPRSTYQWLKCLINEAEPLWIIHTGDVADDIKLENAPKRLEGAYIHALKDFKNTIGKYENRLVIIVGNHDREELLRNILPQAKVVKEPYPFQVANLTMLLSHKPIDCQEYTGGYDFILYGHRPDSSVSLKCLNGIYSAYIITLDGEVMPVNYPSGTNKHRKLRWGDGNDLIHRGP